MNLQVEKIFFWNNLKMFHNMTCENFCLRTEILEEEASHQALVQVLWTW